MVVIVAHILCSQREYCMQPLSHLQAVLGTTQFEGVIRISTGNLGRDAKCLLQPLRHLKVPSFTCHIECADVEIGGEETKGLVQPLGHLQVTVHTAQVKGVIVVSKSILGSETESRLQPLRYCQVAIFTTLPEGTVVLVACIPTCQPKGLVQPLRHLKLAILTAENKNMAVEEGFFIDAQCVVHPLGNLQFPSRCNGNQSSVGGLLVAGDVGQPVPNRRAPNFKQFSPAPRFPPSPECMADVEVAVHRGLHGMAHEAQSINVLQGQATEEFVAEHIARKGRKATWARHGCK
mmetsp:Transcript_96088/g.275977  ORF Transcript_96088/g.275977 Transcript_96088/m.275977 type:complete len:291 (+) Transcript_96088:435-1307(+)